MSATVQSALGFGQSLLLAPGLLAAVPPGTAVLAALLLALLVNALVLGAERRRPAPDGVRVRRFVAAGVPGMAAGLAVLLVVERPALQVAAGAVVLLGLLVRRAPATAARPGTDLAAGAASGLLNTTTSLSGPPLVLALRGGAPGQVRDTITAALLVLNVVGAGLVLAAGPGDRADGLLLAGVLSPAVLLGHRLGRAAFERLDARRYERAAVALVAVAGAASVAAGLA